MTNQPAAPVAKPGSAPAATTTPATGTAPAAKKPRKNEGSRELIESVAVAFILAFLFRTFEAEAFVIPTGSMAPTLYGQHRDVYCKQCGQRFASSGSMDIDKNGTINSSNRTAAAICPNCRWPNDVIEAEIFGGDRILVTKLPWEQAAPSRFNVIVFKYPEEPKINYIKRLIGLPGEELKLRVGDVYVRPLGSQAPFRIPRKAPDKQRDLQLLVYDDTLAPRALLKAGFPERWQPASGARWAANADTRTYRLDAETAADGEWQLLRYRHLLPETIDWQNAVTEGKPRTDIRPQLISDVYGYNDRVTLRELRNQLNNGAKIPSLEYSGDGQLWVPDLTINAKVEVLSSAGELQFELNKGQRTFHCQIDVQTGMAAFSYESREFAEEANRPDEFPLGKAQTSVKGAGTYWISFANVDDRLCLWVNGSLVEDKSLILEFNPDAQDAKYRPQEMPVLPTDKDLMPVSIGGRKISVIVSNLLLQRDIYYRDTRSNMDAEESNMRGALLYEPDAYRRTYINEYQIRERREPNTYKLTDFDDDQFDEFFALGDNSPQSRDSRMWDEVAVEHPHAIARRYLIGKAFYIFWPHAIPMFNNNTGLISLSGYKEHVGNGIAPALPPSPYWSLPWYPQVTRMKRIR